MHCQPCSILPPAADIPRALLSGRQLRGRAPHTPLPYLPASNSFSRHRYAAVTPEPSARRPRAGARPRSRPWRASTSHSGRIHNRASRKWPRPVTLTARGHTPSIPAQRAGLACGPRAPPAGAWDPATFARSFLSQFSSVPYTPRFIHNFCCPTNHFLTCL